MERHRQRVYGGVEESTTRPYTGLRISWHASQALSIDLSADFTRFRLQGDSYNARMVGLGLTYRF